MACGTNVDGLGLAPALAIDLTCLAWRQRRQRRQRRHASRHGALSNCAVQQWMGTASMCILLKRMGFGLQM